MHALAFVRAAELYRAALELSPTDATDLPALRAGLGAALANAGKGLDRLEEAWRALTTGTATPRSEEELFGAIRALRGDARVMRLADVELLCQRLEDLVGLARARSYRVHDDVHMVVTMAFQFLAMLLLRSADVQPGDIDLQGFSRQLEQVIADRLGEVGAERGDRRDAAVTAQPHVEIQEFTSDALTIEARLGAASAHLVFRGEGEARDPAPFLAGVTKELVPKLEKKKVTIDFRRLRRMNSSTVASILILIRALDQKRISTVLDYDTSIEWQRVNFHCMKAIARSLQSIDVVSGNAPTSRSGGEGRM
jgi:chemotaxis protein histidine kinase CheA